jgi:cell division protein FtsZ
VFTFEITSSPAEMSQVSEAAPAASAAGAEQFNGVKIEQVTKTTPGFDFLRTFSNKDVEVKQEEKSKDRTQKLEEMSHKIKTAEGLLELEKQPAYLRKKVELTDSVPSSETEVSRYSLFKNENGVEMKPNNSFLHDNVD